MAAEHYLDDIPELDETEVTIAIARRPCIEDSNDMGEPYAGFSIGLDAADCCDEADW